MYVDVGANDGLIVSNTTYIELDLDWNGICINHIQKHIINLKKKTEILKNITVV
jgi:hypothetical protein